MNPHLTPEKFDIFTHKWHCGECEDELGNYGNFTENIYLGNWHHYRYVDIPGIVARDERGMTIENQWQREPRKVITKISNLSAVHFHYSCLPQLQPITDYQDGDMECAKWDCAGAVCMEHTESTLLWLGPNNLKIIKRLKWHPECLPKIFKGV